MFNREHKALRKQRDLDWQKRKREACKKFKADLEAAMIETQERIFVEEMNVANGSDSEALVCERNKMVGLLLKKENFENNTHETQGTNT